MPVKDLALHYIKIVLRKKSLLESEKAFMNEILKGKVSRVVYVQNYFSFPRGKNKGKWQCDHKILSE